MLLITCPHCGPRAQVEFVYERTVDSVVQPDAEAAGAMEALFARGNPRGLDEELWRHTFGCRAWLILTRHRVTHQIAAIRAVGPEALP
ncbi:sarcosine oxidase subunit delta [Novosphingobium aquiterrae]|uniref:Sarcosine oxidase subunit delta n=1 Tax=Novosphingobium aquiterrae TaxID=624388 RepID=A0ABV6PLG7_9SPHN